jgi:O-antigen/teichoic acid export membrane protein
LTAVAGFALAVVIGRGLGPEASGAFFSVVAIAMVATTISKAGADTGVVWALPRATALGRTSELLPTVRAALTPVLLLGLAFAAVLFAAAPWLSELITGRATGDVATMLRVVAPFLVVGPTFAVLVAALRGTGDIVAYTVLQNIGVPVLRASLAALVIAGGAGVVAVTVTWTSPPLVAAVVAALVLRRRLHRLSAGVRSSRPEMRAEFWRFSSARALSSVLEVLLVWSDVLLVAALASPEQAGIYAAASRFVTTGTLVEAALRVALAPRVSAAFAVQDVATAARLHSMATSWIVLLSWPLYLVLAGHSRLVLGLFGPDFVSGAVPLTILACAMLVATAAGNSQTVLLMSGRSGWQMLDKALAVFVNLVLCAVLIPRYGMTGAAVAWGATITLDSAVVWLQVRYLLGVRGDMRPASRLMALALLCFGAPAVLTRAVLGQEMWPVLGVVLLGGSAYVVLLRRVSGISVQSLRPPAVPLHRPPGDAAST